MIAELESIRKLGWRGMIFIVDDNFIGNKARVKEFLRELIKWNERTGSTTGFITEASVNLADDEELLELMSQARFKRVFLGIETPSLQSLDECRKFQNSRRNLAESVRIIQRAGLEVMGGFIVGFDSDPEDIFERQFEFIQQTGIVTAMVGLLTALPKTRLYHRLIKEGRLREGASGNNTDGVLNFVPMLDSEYLVSGYRQLMQVLYEPRSYYRRILTFLGEYRPRYKSKESLSWSELAAFFKSLWVMGIWQSGRTEYWKFIVTALVRYPRQFGDAIKLAIFGFHFRRVARKL
jgi:radical SAM superfamily enzyme YgiQ (UPF0313 family)